MSESRYNFDRVLVAKTSLLAPPGSDRNATRSRQPDVLVLNNKLNKCSREASSYPQCSSCCLRIERPEFRRRSSFLANQNYQGECFAQCSDKRNVSIQLTAKAQLSGKIVILALTEVAGHSHQVDRQSLSCRLDNSWPFHRFNPKLAVEEQQASRPRQTYYAKLNAHQVPSLSILSMSIVREHERESISLALESAKIGPGQQVVLKETLLVNQFLCYPPNRTLEDPTQVSKVHLFALINRDLPSISAQNHSLGHIGEGGNIHGKQESANVDPVGSDKETKSKGPIGDRPDDKLNITKSFSGLDPSERVGSRMDDNSEATSLSSINIDLKENRRAISTSSPATATTTTTTATYPTMINSPATPTTTNPPQGDQQAASSDVSTISSVDSPSIFSSFPTLIDQRMDLTSSIKTTAGNFLSSMPASNVNTIYSGASAIPSNQIRPINANAPTTIPTKIGPPYLTELDLIRIRLKSSSLLMFTVSSCFVILTYTLCLLIYLKFRQRNQQSNQSNASSSTRIIKNNSKITNPGDNSNNIQISEPFNLQMPLATKTRLDIMLGLNRKKKNRAQRSHRQLNNQPPLPGLANAHCDSYDERVYSRCLPQDCIIYGLAHLNNQLYEDVPEFNHPQVSPYQLDHGHPDGCFDQEYYAHDPVNVVQAIKEAATIARSRFKTSSFIPNLNVIPESDSEYLQESPKDELELLANFLSNNLAQEFISSDQIDSLVQEAMSRECSHLNNETTYESNKTLFSKPHIAFGPMTSDNRVSRSRILQQD